MHLVIRVCPVARFPLCGTVQASSRAIFLAQNTYQMGKRKVHAAAESPESANENALQTTDSEAEAAKRAPAKKRGRQKAPEQPVLPAYNVSMRPPVYDGPAMQVLSWNVASLRAMLTKNPAALKQLVEAENADVVCLQETKMQDKAIEQMEALVGLPGWHCAWNCSTAKKGYSGTAILSKSKPLSIRHGMGKDEHDKEGRLITAEYPTLYVVNAYIPNSGEGLKRLDYRLQQWDVHFAEYLQQLATKKPVVLTGDLNCAHQEIDIHAPKKNLRSPGFTQEERDSFSKLLIGGGFTDAWRRQHPEITGYTYWNYRFNTRTSNKGWRLDYFLVSETLLEQVYDCFHLSDFMGSDHCPVGLVLRH